MNGNKVLVALSGGVDSSTTAYLIKQSGFHCCGATMILCCGKELECNDAQAVAEFIGMDFSVLDYRKEFEEKVIGNFIGCYKAGLTPNPCVQCNIHLKFGSFLEYAVHAGFDYIATGHYAQIIHEDSSNRFFLKRATNIQKDQSYFLYSMTQYQLAHTLFPLGTYSKEEVRGIADSIGFSVAHKKDSQDICFVQDGDYVRFIEKHTGETFDPGYFYNSEGKIIGTHKGAIHYTYGQRKGLGLSLPQPGYVFKKDMLSNAVFIGDEDLLFSTGMHVHTLNWIMWETPPREFTCMVKTRYRQDPFRACVSVCEDGTANVHFESPQRAVTPGQSAVFYHEDFVLGGGIISEDRP